MRVDTVILDLDGVIVDVSNSYRRAIIEAINQVYGETIPKTAVQFFKNAGGFNNDWELTDAAALYVLACREGLSLDVKGFTIEIAERGGGLNAARETIDTKLNASDDVLAAWKPERLREIFQQLYLGADLYRELEAKEPEINTQGYIHDETVLLDPSIREELMENYRIGVFTGRPASEATIALERAGIEIPNEHCFTMDDDIPGKPVPDGLIRLAEALGGTAVAFVGDTVDDMQTVVNARSIDTTRDYFGIGVLTGTTDTDQFEAAGATVVIRSVNELPNLFEPT